MFSDRDPDSLTEYGQTEYTGEEPDLPTDEAIEQPAITAPNIDDNDVTPEAPDIARGSGYVVVGRAADYPNQLHNFAQKVQAGQSRQDLLHAHEPTDDEAVLIERINDAYVELGDEVGAEVQPRLVRPSQVYMYDSHTEMAESYADRYGKPLGDRTMGMHITAEGILSERTGDLQRDRSTVAHEEGHAADLKFVQLDLSGTGLIVVDNYSGLPWQVETEEASGLTEYGTDLAAANVLHKAGLGPIAESRGNLNFIGDLLVQKTALVYGTSPYDIEKLIIRDKLAGTMDGIRAVDNACGQTEAQTDLILNLPANIPGQDFGRVFRTLFGATNSKIMDEIFKPMRVPHQWRRD